MIDDRLAPLGGVDVSRETIERLETYVKLLRQWQKVQNLVAAATLEDVWQRHIADSAQLAVLFPNVRRWLDLGSGAGFPGMILAILGAGHADCEVHLVEINHRKCAFLRTVARETGAPVTVHAGRAETLLAGWPHPVDRVVARALARLNRLISLASPILLDGTPAAFHKGQDFVHEVHEATKYWAFDLVEHSSPIIEGSVILDITGVRRRDADG